LFKSRTWYSLAQLFAPHKSKNSKTRAPRFKYRVGII
jgi:hypothetical protein